VNKKKIIITAIVVLAVIILGIKGKYLLEKRKTEVANKALPATEIVSVPVVQATQGTLRHTESYLAQIVSDKSIKLSTKLAGYVEKVYVSESQVVKKGDVLVSIDAVEIRSNIDALKATLLAQKSDVTLAKSIYTRNQKLYKVGGLSKEKLDISKVTLQAKEAVITNTAQKIAQLEHQLSYLKIIAPFDGVVDAILMHEGDLAATGKPIVSMSNGKKKLVFSYAPTKGTMIVKDQMVLLDAKRVGHVKAIYTTSKNGLISAEVALSSEIDLPVGSSVNIEVLTKEAQGCLLPQGTLLHKKEGTFVMVYEKGSFKPLKVNVKMQEESQMIISPCPTGSVAQASEVKLATLPAYSKVKVLGESNE
jgi:RND family efflux transporter MFP subunit